MLVRAYRITDKMGVVALKTSAVLLAALATSLHEFLGGGWRVVTGVLSLLLGILMAVGAVIWMIIRRVVLGLWAVMRFVGQGVLALLALILGGVLWLGRGAARLSGGAVRYAGAGTGNVMARRAARVELESNLAEDPLRVQNRLLSAGVVVLLAVLLIVVVVATNQPQTPAPLAVVDAGPALLGQTPQTTDVPVLLATPVPTVTPLPSILEARGSLAYTVRENGQEDIWTVGVGDRAPLRLTNSIEDDREPAWSPDGRRLAYASRQDGNWELYIYDTVTGTTTRMTYDLSFQGAPRWSPDGEWLVYESYQGGNLDVYIMRADGSQVERLTEHAEPDFAPVWSPDGRRVAFVSWRDGNQDIYVFSLDDPRDTASVNLTNTPGRNEDHPVWSPDGSLLAYSAVDEGVPKVFVKPASDPDSVAQVIGRGRMPTWSPDGSSLIAVVDSIDSTQLVALPFSGTGVATLVIPVAPGAASPDWSAAPLPPNLVNSGGLDSSTTALFVEQSEQIDDDPPYRLNTLVDVDTPVAALSDRVNDSFNALREGVLEASGVDFLGQLEDAFWPLERLPQPGEERRNWHMTGRAFSVNRNAIVGFPPPIEIVREDRDVNTYWRLFLRAAEDAQNGELGEPLRRLPWDFLSRSQGDVEAYNQGGRLRSSVPGGYYVDLTEMAADYGWQRVPAGTDWRGNFNSTNYWMFVKNEDNLSWYDAMRELYTEGQLINFAPRSTTVPVVVSPEPADIDMVAPTEPPPTAPAQTPAPGLGPLLPPPVDTGE